MQHGNDLEVPENPRYTSCTLDTNCSKKRRWKELVDQLLGRFASEGCDEPVQSLICQLKKPPQKQSHCKRKSTHKWNAKCRTGSWSGWRWQETHWLSDSTMAPMAHRPSSVRKFTTHLLSPESLKPKRQTQQTSVQTLVYQREHLNMFVCLPDFKEPNRTTCTQNKHQFKKLSCGLLDVV